MDPRYPYAAEHQDIEIVPKISATLVENCTARHRVVVGGRGRGASWSIARILLAEGLAAPHFIACVREYQASIQHSVKRLLEGQIQILNLGSHYTSTRTEIRGANGSKFVFFGLRDHDTEKIKSLEGATRCWVEEAESLSRRSVDTLRPTIRAPGSVVWWSLNPTRITDPVYTDYVATETPPADSAICWVSMDDNPWRTPELIAQRESDYARDPDEAAHIWEGKLRGVSENFVFSLSDVEAAMARDDPPRGSGDVYIGADIAHRGGDEIVFYAANSSGIIGARYARRESTVQTRQALMEFADAHGAGSIIIDNGHVGAAVADEVQAYRYDLIVNRVDFGGRPRDRRFRDRATEIYWGARELLPTISIPRDPMLRDQMVSRRWSYVSSSEGERITIESKRDIRTSPGWSSPDRADALVLALSRLSGTTGIAGAALGFSIY